MSRPLPQYLVDRMNIPASEREAEAETTRFITGFATDNGWAQDHILFAWARLPIASRLTVVRRGPVAGDCPSAVLMARIRDAPRACADCGMPPGGMFYACGPCGIGAQGNQWFCAGCIRAHWRHCRQAADDWRPHHNADRAGGRPRRDQVPSGDAVPTNVADGRLLRAPGAPRINKQVLFQRVEPLLRSASAASRDERLQLARQVTDMLHGAPDLEEALADAALFYTKTIDALWTVQSRRGMHTRPGGRPAAHPRRYDDWGRAAAVEDWGAAVPHGIEHAAGDVWARREPASGGPGDAGAGPARGSRRRSRSAHSRGPAGSTRALTAPAAVNPVAAAVGHRFAPAPVVAEGIGQLEPVFRGDWPEDIVAHNDRILLEQTYRAEGQAHAVGPAPETARICCAPFEPQRSEAPRFPVTHVCTVQTDTVTAAVAVGDAVILCFGHAAKPGGEHRGRSHAQEEELCRLLPHLEASLQACAMTLYPICPGQALLTRGVPIIRCPGTYRLTTPLGTVGVVTAAAPRRTPPVWSTAWHATVTLRMRAVLQAAKESGRPNLVLGAWGCGGRGNPPEGMALLWARTLSSPEFRGAFDRVIFAIYERHGSAAYDAFARVITDNLSSAATASASQAALPDAAAGHAGAQGVELSAEETALLTAPGGPASTDAPATTARDAAGQPPDISSMLPALPRLQADLQAQGSSVVVTYTWTPDPAALPVGGDVAVFLPVVVGDTLQLVHPATQEFYGARHMVSGILGWVPLPAVQQPAPQASQAALESVPPAGAGAEAAATTSGLAEAHEPQRRAHLGRSEWAVSVSATASGHKPARGRLDDAARTLAPCMYNHECIICGRMGGATQQCLSCLEFACPRHIHSFSHACRTPPELDRWPWAPEPRGHATAAGRPAAESMHRGDVLRQVPTVPTTGPAAPAADEDRIRPAVSAHAFREARGKCRASRRADGKFWCIDANTEFLVLLVRQLRSMVRGAVDVLLTLGSDEVAVGWRDRVAAEWPIASDVDCITLFQGPHLSHGKKECAWDSRPCFESMDGATADAVVRCFLAQRRRFLRNADGRDAPMLHLIHCAYGLHRSQSGCRGIHTVLIDADIFPVVVVNASLFYRRWAPPALLAFVTDRVGQRIRAQLNLEVGLPRIVADDNRMPPLAGSAATTVANADALSMLHAYSDACDLMDDMHSYFVKIGATRPALHFFGTVPPPVAAAVPTPAAERLANVAPMAPALPLPDRSTAPPPDSSAEVPTEAPDPAQQHAVSSDAGEERRPTGLGIDVASADGDSEEEALCYAGRGSVRAADLVDILAAEADDIPSRGDTEVLDGADCSPAVAPPVPTGAEFSLDEMDRDILELSGEVPALPAAPPATLLAASPSVRPLAPDAADARACDVAPGDTRPSPTYMEFYDEVAQKRVVLPVKAAPTRGRPPATAATGVSAAQETGPTVAAREEPLVPPLAAPAAVDPWARPPPPRAAIPDADAIAEAKAVAVAQAKAAAALAVAAYAAVDRSPGSPDPPPPPAPSVPHHPPPPPAKATALDPTSAMWRDRLGPAGWLAPPRAWPVPEPGRRRVLFAEPLAQPAGTQPPTSAPPIFRGGETAEDNPWAELQ